MNGLYIHASHHGSVTIVSDNEVIVHAQLDRFNRYKNSGLPSYSVIEKILSLKIKFNKLFISFLKNQNHLKEWLSFLNQFKVIDKYFMILETTIFTTRIVQGLYILVLGIF